MSNEELVREIRNGNADKKVDLWCQVKQTVNNAANRVIYALSNSRVYEYDDLIQIGYLALEKAIDTYDDNADYKFITHYWYKLKTEIASQTDYRTSAQKAKLTHSAISLDTTILNESGNKCCLQDLLPDPTNYFEHIEEDDYEAWRRSIIIEAVNLLAENEKQVIYSYYYENKTLIEIATLLGISYQRVSQIRNKALTNLRKNPKLQELYWGDENYTDYSYCCGLSYQKRTGHSVVESIVERRNERLSVF